MPYFCCVGIPTIPTIKQNITMKLKQLSLTLVALLFGLGAMAQQHPLMGVWQQQTFEKGGPEGPKLINLPVWKVIGGDGTFTAFMITNHEMYCTRYEEGTYRILSDSTYAEQIDKHLVRETLSGTLNVLNYKFLTEDELTVTYQIPGSESPAVEIWRRVKLEKPQDFRRPGEGRPHPRQDRKTFSGPDADDIDD